MQVQKKRGPYLKTIVAQATKAADVRRITGFKDNWAFYVTAKRNHAEEWLGTIRQDIEHFGSYLHIKAQLDLTPDDLVWQWRWLGQAVLERHAASSRTTRRSPQVTVRQVELYMRRHRRG